MKVTLNWLKQYVDFNWSPEETTERLTMLGLEVEGVQKISGAFDGIVVAQVVTRDKHPNADKLSLCRVNDGTGERQIVCGAQNFKAGDKVSLILPGASLPAKAGEKEPFTIKVGMIRGVESHGMLCSPQELGLPDQVDGLLILREDAKVGQSFGEYLGRSGSDVVYDLEVTPNRPDLNSVIGIAREIAAVTGNPLKIPEVKSPKSEARADGLVAVRIEDTELCPRYTARVIKGVKVGPSPDWLRSTLEKVGIRSISNVVDVTNYVMLEIGQPLHAFDYHLIAKGANGKPTIVVRRAIAGEKFKTLDNQERTLTSEMLLIADETKGIALAGVMGGANTEINDQTVDVLIESACFSPTNIRRTSKQLGLRSESSYRFERGADVGICDWASQRAAQLILETAGGQLADGVVDAHPKPIDPKHVTLRHHRVNELLGITLQPQEMEFYLGQLGLKVVNRKARPVGDDEPTEPTTFQIPTWRVDLKREVDLIEEIERLHGLEKVPATPPRGAIGSSDFDTVYDQLAKARQLLVGLGLYEAQGQTLLSENAAQLIPESRTTLLNRLVKPLSSEMDTLRPGLLPGLIASLRVHALRNIHDVSLFEIGRIFLTDGEQPIEELSLGVAITGHRYHTFWSGEERKLKTDIYDLKGVIEEFLEHFGVRGISFEPVLNHNAPFVDFAFLKLGGKKEVGYIAQLHPKRAKEFDLRDSVFVAEISLDLLLKIRDERKSFKPLPTFPSVRRDVAIIVPNTITQNDVISVVRQVKPANLEQVHLFDVFSGKHVPDGQKSLAYAFTYRAADKTLTDAEVNAAHEKVVAAFKTQLQATVRE